MSDKKDPSLERLDTIVTTLKRQGAEPRSALDSAAMWAAFRRDMRVLLADVAIEYAPIGKYDDHARNEIRARFGVKEEA